MTLKKARQAYKLALNGNLVDAGLLIRDSENEDMQRAYREINNGRRDYALGHIDSAIRGRRIWSL